jgi:hypothetical protein
MDRSVYSSDKLWGKVPDVQKILTDYGCNIRTILGLHEVSKKVCSQLELLILDTCGDEAEVLEMEKKAKEGERACREKIIF